MRIGIDARPLSGPIDGIGRYTREVVSRLLLQKQHQWFLYSHGPIAVDNLEHATARHPESTSRFRNIQSLFNLGFWSNKDQLDLFWTPRHHLPIWKVNAAKVTTVHDLCWRELPSSMPWSRRLRERMLFTSSINRSQRVLAVSKATANTLLQNNNKTESNIVVTPLASSFTAKFENSVAHNAAPEQPISKPYLLFVGTIEPRKNLALLLHAFAQLTSKVPHRLVIAGRQGWGDLDLQSFLRASTAANRILWVNDASDRQLEQLYRDAALLVSLSHYEGFGLYALEAMSLGTPTLLSDIAAHREIAGAAATYIKPESPTQVAQALAALLDNPRQLEESCRQGLARAAEFSWDKTASKTLAALESCTLAQ